MRAIFEITGNCYLASSAPATSAEIKKGELAKTSLSKEHEEKVNVENSCLPPSMVGTDILKVSLGPLCSSQVILAWFYFLPINQLLQINF